MRFTFIVCFLFFPLQNVFSATSQFQQKQVQQQQQQTQNKKITVILIPGFFNSLAEGYSRQHPEFGHEKKPYFSQDIVETIEGLGHKTYVVDGLMPVGSLSQNGSILSNELQQVSMTRKSEEYWVIAHSAGGLYLLDALQRKPKINITKVFTISTPYEGVDLVQKGIQIPGLKKVAEWLNLSSLIELTPDNVKRFLARVQWPKNIKWYAASSSADPCFLLSCAKAEKLSWVMTATHHFIGKASDGIVAYQSGIGANSSLPIERVETINIQTEHWESVLNFKFFKLLGVVNNAWVRDEQIRTYKSAIEILRN